MNQTNTNHGTTPDPIAVLLRLAADDELTADQRAELDAHLRANPEDARRVEFEIALRSSVGRVMQDIPATPAGLRDRVMASVEQHASENHDEYAERIQARATQTRDRSFWASPALVRWASGVAALLVIAAALAVMLSQPFGSGSSGGPGDPSYEVQLSGFLSGEHNRCAIQAGKDPKFSVRDPAEAPEHLRSILGTSPTLPDLIGTGLEFVGAGECHVPGKGRSVHLQFVRHSQEAGVAMPVSLFVKQARGELPLQEGVTYEIDCEEGGIVPASQECTGVCRALIWQADGLVYYLISECGQTRDTMRDRLDVQPATQQI